MQNDLWIVTLDTEKLWVAGFAALALVLVALLLWSGRRRENLLEDLGREWLDGLYVVVGLFFLVALGATAVVLFDTFRNVAHPPAAGSSPNLGAGALIAAILGAPFVIWGTVLKHQTLRYTKEGHITDRISKAVEQLGAVKTVERIGRPVTILTGEPERINYPEDAAIKFADKPRTKLSPKEWGESWDDVADDVEEGYRQTVSTWPEERTVIQWQGEAVELKRHEAIGLEGQWQVFKETVPNIEVRIGGLLSLERISQDSVTYDKGRDHVRIMEILCAYVRNNAPLSKALDFDPIAAKDHLDDTEISKTDRRSLKAKIDALDAPRSDVAIALKIIGRRTVEQRGIERSATEFGKEGYRPNLRETCLQKADMEKGNFDRVVFFRSRLDGAYLNESSFVDCNFIYAKMTGCSARNGIFDQSRFASSNLSGSLLDKASFTKSRFGRYVYFLDSQLYDSTFEFCEDVGAANRAFFNGTLFQRTTLSGDLDSAIAFVGIAPQRTAWQGRNPLKLRNARLSDDLLQRFLPENTFADGSVTLFGGHRPDHWHSEVLDDSAYKQAYLNFVQAMKS